MYGEVYGLMLYFRPYVVRWKLFFSGASSSDLITLTRGNQAGPRNGLFLMLVKFFPDFFSLSYRTAQEANLIEIYTRYLFWKRYLWAFIPDKLHARKMVFNKHFYK